MYVVVGFWRVFGGELIINEIGVVVVVDEVVVEGF